MEALTRQERVASVSAAAAHDLNDELAILLSASDLALRTVKSGDPARALLLDIRAAAQRSTWIVAGLLRFSIAKGARPSAAHLEALANEQ